MRQGEEEEEEFPVQGMGVSTSQATQREREREIEREETWRESLLGSTTCHLSAPWHAGAAFAY